ncbi:MAG: hypothetical protein LKE64_00055 [Solobacterium sp.]|jgi:hypothetical protein|nr:hypothetical protein [Solobacterium sp.]MCH4033810.1 hypothetical protein [Lachnospiraceae bacterium]MCH4050163.1 hypothetical protein [Solobacterium sp.]MCH4073849.1 hypothetical protein [Solobacterium sp.]
MWNKGSLLIPTDDGEKTCRYCVKTCGEKSETYGIEDGRIIKMEIRVDGKQTLLYERGWEVEPEDETTQLAYAVLIKKFN